MPKEKIGTLRQAAVQIWHTCRINGRQADAELTHLYNGNLLYN